MIGYYFWYGSEEPKYVKACKRSWLDSGIEPMKIPFNLDDYKDIPFIQYAVKRNEFAYIANFARCNWFRNNTGLYLDTDMFLIKEIDETYYSDCDLLIACESKATANVGLFYVNNGGQKYFEYIYQHYLSYNKNDIKIPLLPNIITKEIFNKKYNIKLNVNYYDIVIHNNIKFLGAAYCYPLYFVMNRKKHPHLFFEKTFGIHQWHASGKSWKKSFMKKLDIVYQENKEVLENVLKEHNRTYWTRDESI